MPDSAGWILNFQAPVTDPADLVLQAGGKGANLARLAQAGLPVPEGFILTTAAYRDFVNANGLADLILTALPPGGSIGPDALDESSRIIRSLFASGQMPPALEADLRFAYAALGSPPVAVRSSATAEDTLELSFAGQQDTFLNVIDDHSLLQAVIDCWSSLWTARAIGYRTHNRIPHAGLALAVVVQRMVPSEVSGVLFTSNPLTGLRSESVIDAAFGLGEALVSGKVEPDQYLVDTSSNQITRKTLGAKARALHSQSTGGISWDETNHSQVQALPDEQILAVAQMGEQIETLYGLPQDIEWAWADQHLYLLQSRPVTSLFPIPPGLTPNPLKVMVSFGAVQGLLDPITPLGRDTFRYICSIAAGLFGIKMTPENQTIVFTSGERLWMNITTPFTNSVGRKVILGAIALVEPGARETLKALSADPRLQLGKPGISWHARRQIAHFAVPLFGNVLLNLIAPAARRKSIVAHGEALLAEVQTEIAKVEGTPRERLGFLSALLPQVVDVRLPRLFIKFVSGVVTAMASLQAVNKLSHRLAPETSEKSDQLFQNHVLEIMRGLPHNPTTEMDLLLWDTAQVIRSDAVQMEYFQSKTPVELGRDWKDGKFLPAAKTSLQPFLDRYGGRGLGEIDLGRERWVENPTPVFEALTGYLKMDDPALAPNALFERGAAAAQQAIDQMALQLRSTRGGWFKALLLKFFARRVRRLMGIRESPKFFAVRLFNLIRQELLKCGAELVAAGKLILSDDLMYLTYTEMADFANQDDSTAWRELIASRRRAAELEKHRRQIPRLLLSDGRAFYEGIQAAEGSTAIAGSPVSPGSVEGSVRVVLNPHHADLQPGEIMVCPGTDPSWTPLFLTASGLIMEVGGMMTHGAVVAREYGIPAVVGVDRATERLSTGMRIRLDGSSGQIVILE